MIKKKSNTCLAVLKDQNGVLYFAADRRMSWGMHKAQVSPRSKVTYRNNILIMGTGHSNICDLVTDQMPIPDLISDSYTYMHEIFMPNLYKFLKSRLLLDKEAPCLTVEGEAIIILGVHSDVYEITLDSDHIDFGCVNTPHTAGCGGSYALGSLLTTEDTKMSPKQRLTKALEVAAAISPGCDANIDILDNKNLVLKK